jgi:hypothetical protein
MIAIPEKFSVLKCIGFVSSLLVCSVVSAAPSVDMTLNIEGTISPLCMIDRRSAPENFVLTDAPGSHSVDFRVDCNVPMAVRMTSERGGLEHDQYKAWPASPGFTGFLPYRATFQVNTDGARPVTGESEFMREGVTGVTGVTPYRSQARLTLDWAPEATLLGGTYRDTITIRVSGEGETGIPATP